MIIQPQTFIIPKRLMTRDRRFRYILVVTVTILALFEILIAEDFDIQRFLTFLSPIQPSVFDTIGRFVMLLLIFSATYAYISGGGGQIKLHVGPEGLVREEGRSKVMSTWDSITRVRFKNTPDGELRSIQIFTAKGPELVLFGYESMDEVARLIKNGIPPVAQLETKQDWLEWERPLIVASIILLAWIVFETTRRISGHSVYETFWALLPIALGVYILANRSISQTEPNLRKVEIACCVVMIVGSLMRLILR